MTELLLAPRLMACAEAADCVCRTTQECCGRKDLPLIITLVNANDFVKRWMLCEEADSVTRCTKNLSDYFCSMLKIKPFKISVLLSFGVFAAESYPELMDQAEKLMNRRYEKGTRAYKIKSAELDEILESKETREEKIARLKKFIAEFQPAQTVQTSGAAVSKEQIWQYLKDIRQCEKEAENGDSVAQLALGLHYMNLENPIRQLHLNGRSAPLKVEFRVRLCSWG